MSAGTSTLTKRRDVRRLGCDRADHRRARLVAAASMAAEMLNDSVGGCSSRDPGPGGWASGSRCRWGDRGIFSVPYAPKSQHAFPRRTVGPQGFTRRAFGSQSVLVLLCWRWASRRQSSSARSRSQRATLGSSARLQPGDLAWLNRRAGDERRRRRLRSPGCSVRRPAQVIHFPRGGRKLLRVPRRAGNRRLARHCERRPPAIPGATRRVRARAGTLPLCI